MKLQELQHLAAAGVRVEISAADILDVCQELARAHGKETQTAAEFIPLSEATELYRRSDKTLRKYIADGILRGYKNGGKWSVESPAAHINRLSV